MYVPSKIAHLLLENYLLTTKHFDCFPIKLTRCDDVIHQKNWYGSLDAWYARVCLFCGGLLRKGDARSVILAMLEDGTLVLFVMIHAKRVSKPLGCMGVWRFAG